MLSLPCCRLELPLVVHHMLMYSGAYSAAYIHSILERALACVTKALASLQHWSVGVGPMAIACLKSAALILASAGPLIWNSAMKGRHSPTTSCFSAARHALPSAWQLDFLRLPKGSGLQVTAPRATCINVCALEAPR